MIIQCQGCAAKYFLPEDRVPPEPLKVRCPKCAAVFTLVPRRETVPAGAAADPVPPAPPEETPSAATVAEQPAAAPAPPEVDTAPKPKKGKGKQTKDDRAKRLARVLVSDILWYNRDKRDQALESGTLMTALSEEIKKSWELYKEKVGPELASSTNYFKEALNEILADGQKIF